MARGLLLVLCLSIATLEADAAAEPLNRDDTNVLVQSAVELHHRGARARSLTAPMTQAFDPIAARPRVLVSLDNTMEVAMESCSASTATDGDGRGQCDCMDTHTSSRRATVDGTLTTPLARGERRWRMAWSTGSSRIERADQENMTAYTSREVPLELAQAEAEAEKAVTEGGKDGAQAQLETLRERVAKVMSDKAPYYWHASPYRDQDFESVYPLSDADLARMVPEGNYSWLLPLMRKLEAGGNASIVVFGGSMTHGNGCQQLPGQSPTDCAWSARFVSWLQKKFPKSKITLDNRGLCGASTGHHLATLGIVLKTLKYDVDLAILDTSVNRDSSPEYEHVIRALHEIVPNTAIFGLVTSPASASSSNHSHQIRLLRQYGVPRLDFGQLAIDKNALWQCRDNGVTTHTNHGKIFQWSPDYVSKWPIPQGAHPSWHTHQMIADVMASMWGRAWDARSANPSADEQAWGATKLGAPTEGGDGSLGTCKEPLAYFSARSAFDARPSPGAELAATSGWRLYEDRPGKPGWIAEETSSSIRFPLKFGGTPTIALVYLRSYEGLGNATFSLHATGSQKGKDIHWETELQGSWDSHTSETVVLLTKINRGFLGKIANLDVSLKDGPKFKLIEVISC